MRAMRRALILLVFLPLAIGGCKKRPPEDATPAPTGAPAAPRVVEEAVDGLNAPPPPPPKTFDMARRADTINGDPNGPKAGDLDAAQADGQRRVQSCLDALPAAALPGGAVRLTVKYTVGNDGKARDVAVDGGLAAATDCGKRSLESVTFPTFQGPPIANAFSLSYSRPQAAPEQAPPR